MPHTRKTLELSERWDLLLTSSGDIAVRNGDIATAQNVANEGRLFTDDAYFIQDKGIPHFSVELGKSSASSILLEAQLRTAARRVDDVSEIVSINVTNFDRKSGTLSGEITFTTIEGENDAAITTYF